MIHLIDFLQLIYWGVFKDHKGGCSSVGHERSVLIVRLFSQDGN